MRKLLLQKCIGKVRGGQKDLTSAHLQSVSELFDRQVGKQIDLPGGVAAKRTYDGIEIIRQTQSRAETGKSGAGVRRRRKVGTAFCGKRRHFAGRRNPAKKLHEMD